MIASKILALVSLLGCAAAQGVTSIMTPPYDTPATCRHSIDGKFILGYAFLDNQPLKRDANAIVAKRDNVCSKGGVIAELKNGIITDDKGRRGYIASNFQFQFDDPPQSGAIFTAGWGHCPNGSLALGATTVFYGCRSGGFYNLYDRDWAEQCQPISILATECDDTDEIGPNDHVVGSAIVTTTMVINLEDGQPQIVTTTIGDPICEIDDGQLQGQTTPCAAIAGAPKGDVTVVPLTELSDGQIQLTLPGPPATSSVPVTTSGPSPSTTPVPSISSAPRTTLAPSSSSPAPKRPEDPETKTGGAQMSVSANTIVLVCFAIIAMLFSV